ncbi:tRNA pseudouridine(38-40) synthase TruA [Chloroflexota bacterium]
MNNLNNIKLVVEYDGRKYYGFQWQSDLPTIQAELEKAIWKLTGEKKRLIAASRTDTGVHARGQVVSFRTTSSLSLQTVVRALNYYLPGDIAILSAYRVADTFHVRRDAISREYEYRILNRSVKSPLNGGFVHLVTGKLNIRNMNRVCKLLEGKHDFASFTSALDPMKSTIRTVYEAKCSKNCDLVTFRMVANSFLPHQVRNTVGLLIRVGLGKVGFNEFKQTMEAKEAGAAGSAAPPQGLYLMKVNYPTDLELRYENICN